MTGAMDADLSPAWPEDVPGAYPRQDEAHVALADGSRVGVRPLVPADAQRLANAIATGDSETIRRRFLTSAPPANPDTIAYLVGIDYRSRYALLGLDETGNSVGIARYESIGEETAEVAIVVHPEWRRRGLGSHLIRRLEQPAQRNGIELLVAYYQPDNLAVAGLLRGAGYGTPRIDDGLTLVEKSLA